jgi:hypothetical protein
MQGLKTFLTRIAIPLIFLVSIWSSANLRWGQQWKYTISSDGKGYYAYLPAIFIYNDLNIGFFDSIEATYYDAHTKYDFRTNYKGKTIDKYFSGVAVMQLPFFLAGHAATKITGGKADGYSKLYVIFMCLGAIFYLILGLVFLRKYLLAHGATQAQAAFLIAVIYFGTNLFYYAVVEPMMSHVYSFALVSLFLYYGKKWISSENARDALKLCILLGMIILVRPVNFLVVGWLFFEAGGVRTLAQKTTRFLRRVPVALLACFLLFAPLAIQLILYKIETGEFFVDAYGPEGFNFLRPEAGNFLFSYKKGLFVYLPLTFVALFGFVPLWKKDRTRAICGMLFIAMLIYVLSSWWMWYYGGSFGTRVIVEYLPVFALLLLFLLNSIRKNALRTAMIVLLSVLVLHCQLETFQYRYFLIHWSEMNQETYWDVFLKWPK